MRKFLDLEEGDLVVIEIKSIKHREEIEEATVNAKRNPLRKIQGE